MVKPGAHKRTEERLTFVYSIDSSFTNFNCTCVNSRVQSSPYKGKIEHMNSHMQ